MATAPLAVGPASDAASTGECGGKVATANACPQFEQNAAPSAIDAPHLEQYTTSPRAKSALFLQTNKIAGKSYFQVRLGSILYCKGRGGKNFIGLVRRYRS